MADDIAAASMDESFALGRRLLIGDGAPFQPEEGARLIKKAAEQGVVDAIALQATIAAAGVGRPADFNEAFDWLEKAAAAGHVRAAAQLDLIADAWGSGDPATCARRRISLDAWLNPPPREILSDAPRLRTIAGFLTPVVCRWIMEMARGRLTRAMMFNPVTKRDEPHPGRDSQLYIVDITAADVVFALVRARMSAALKIPSACFEPTQILQYDTGQTFLPHYDYLEGRTFTAYDSGQTYEGQRIVTFLVYLNDDYEGGETAFPKAGLKHKGRAGDALFFANVDLDQKPDKQTLHAGLAPTGQKWLLSQWVHDRPFTAVQG